MSKVDIAALLERVRQATGPDRKLDWRIAEATGHPSFERQSSLWPPFMPKSKADKAVPLYTASLDAIVALIERELPGWHLQDVRTCDPSRSPHNPERWCSASLSPNLDNDDEWKAGRVDSGRTAALPLALCDAFLSAKLSLSDHAQT